MKMHEYRQALDTLSHTEEEKCDIAQQMLAASEEPATRPVIKRRKTAWIAAATAAALLAGTTLTVGAAVDWDYNSLFQDFFNKQVEESSGTEPVKYVDLTGMGMDINETVEFEGYTLDIKSVIADAYNIYTLYDITITDTSLIPGEIYDLIPTLSCDIRIDGRRPMGSSGSTASEKISDTVYRFATLDGIADKRDGMLTDAEITIQFMGLTVVSDETIQLEGKYSMPLGDDFVPNPNMTKELDVNFQLPKYGPNCASKITLSPFRIIIDVTEIADQSYFTKEIIMPGEEGYEEYKEKSKAWTITAIYADGTEQTMEGEIQHNMYKHYQDETDCFGATFDRILKYPVNTNEIVAISIDGTIVPVA